MTPAQFRVLSVASKRESGFVCPTPGLPGASQDLVLKALRKRGYITESHSPTITDAGRSAIESQKQIYHDRLDVLAPHTSCEPQTDCKS